MDPLRIEHSFRVLKQELAVLRGNRNKLLRIVRFVEEFQSADGRSFLYAYAQELFSLLVPIVSGTDFSYTNPLFLDRLEHVLSLLVEMLSGEGQSEVWKEGRERIRTARETIHKQMAIRSENGGPVELSVSRKRRRKETAGEKPERRDHV
ncbi:MAG: hypothetical protein V1799_18310 [bacterium]